MTTICESEINYIVKCLDFSKNILDRSTPISSFGIEIDELTEFMASMQTTYHVSSAKNPKFTNQNRQSAVISIFKACRKMYDKLSKVNKIYENIYDYYSIFFLAVDIFDRFTSLFEYDISYTPFVAGASTLIAIKFETQKAISFRMISNLFEFSTHKIYILRMTENLILKILDYHLYVPNSSIFINFIDSTIKPDLESLTIINNVNVILNIFNNKEFLYSELVHCVFSIIVNSNFDYVKFHIPKKKLEFVNNCLDMFKKLSTNLFKKSQLDLIDEFIKYFKETYFPK
jgi:hypothetical protein